MVKVILLSDEAYKKLKAIKRERSFSEVVVKLIGMSSKKKTIIDFYGMWSEDRDELGKIRDRIYEDRKKAKLRGVKF